MAMCNLSQNIISVKLTWSLTLSLEFKTEYLPRLLFVLSFRYFDTVASADETSETHNKHGKYPVLCSNDHARRAE